jgi:hypothetical protein
MFLLAGFFPATREADAVVELLAQAARAITASKVTTAVNTNEVADNTKIRTGRKSRFIATNTP